MNKMDFLKRAVRWTASRIVLLIVLALALWGAYTIGKFVGHGTRTDAPVEAPAASRDEVWTCTMHPEIRMPEPGDCPICGMELVLAEAEESATQAQPSAHDHGAEPAGYACAMFCVPPLPHPGKCPVCGMDMVAVYDEPAGAGDSERRLAMSEEARALADIQTALVVRRHASRELRLVGLIEADETRLARVAAYVGGRLDRLHVRYTGAQVERGAPLAGLYSPELLTARAELQQAKQSAARLADSSVAGARNIADSTVNAARERLRLWGLSDAQVRALESGDGADAIITIPAPISGTVLERHVQQGDYVDTGDLMFTVADLSVVWVQLKAYESDMPFMQIGQRATFSVDAHPGESFEGHVVFIEPVLTGASRTVNARVEVNNADGRLKPGMFARATLEVPVAAPDAEPPLLIPDTAPLLTGRRAVAYVAVPDQERPTYEGREIVLGTRVDGHYVVKEGLREGERVVVNGGFRIDSALQIRARPSMMTAAEQEAVYADTVVAACCAAHDGAAADAAAQTLTGTEQASLQPVIEAYIATQQALAADDLTAAHDGYKALTAAAEKAREEAGEDAAPLWTRTLDTLGGAATEAKDEPEIEEARRHFHPASNALIELLEAYPDAPETPVSRVYCPMAFDDAGAAWLQRGDAVRNPYFGASMLQCGVAQKTYGKSEAEHE